MMKTILVLAIVLAFVSSLCAYSQVGCFRDTGSNRILNGTFTSSKQMTVEKCVRICSLEGDYFAGVEYAFQCFCGKYLKHDEQLSENVCSTPCAGDRKQKCGGTNKISVYTTDVNYLGCFEDKQDRILEDAVTTSNFMTSEMCIQTCQNNGKRFALTENSSLCICGNHLKSYDKKPESDCNYKCAGNSNAICGGHWRGSLYLTHYNAYSHIGCFRDTGSNRILNGTFTSSKQMTIEKCVRICSLEGDYFAGVEYAFQCFCGKYLKHNEQLSENVCSTPCAGDRKQKCGGTNKISVYTTDVNYLGCFEEKETRRILEGAVIDNDRMTTEMCIQTCQNNGKRFAITEHSSKCICGNHLQSYDKKPESDCKHTCAGNTNAICGGDWRGSLYLINSNGRFGNQHIRCLRISCPTTSITATRERLYGIFS